MIIESDYEASESSMMEHLLTDHPYGMEIAKLPDAQIKRLRRMLHDAVQHRIAPQEVYDAITRGFERTFGAVSAPTSTTARRSGHDRAPV